MNSRTAVLQGVIFILCIPRRDGERRHRVDLLPLSPEGLAAGGDDMHRRAAPQHSLGHSGRGINHMLAIVEHEQELIPDQRTGNILS